ncbi:MAG: TolC family protein [Bacteroidales bacterium]
MNNIRIATLISILSVTASGLFSQESLTLAECLEKAGANHKLALEKERYAAISDLSSQILRKAWMPVTDAGASIIYNSDVVDLGSALSGIPVPGLADAIAPIPHSQYRLTLEISQLLYDGGMTRELIRNEEAALKINQQLTEIEIYSIKEQVIANYFGIVLLDKQYRLIKTFVETIESQIEAAASAVRSGVLTPADHDILLAEKLKMEQQSIENRNLDRALRNILGEITGLEISESTSFHISEPAAMPVHESIDLRRPELTLFDLTVSSMNAGEKLLAAGRMPKAYGFATFGYGKPPGNNFFSDSSEPFFVAGAALRWNIYDWDKARREREILNVRRDITTARKSDAEVKLRLMLEAKQAEIETIRESIEKLNEIIALRSRVSAAMTSRLNNGTITASEYLIATNPEREAIISLEIKKINLIKAGYEYLFITGNELK